MQDAYRVVGQQVCKAAVPFCRTPSTSLFLNDSTSRSHMDDFFFDVDHFS